MRSTRWQLLATLLATVLAAGAFVHRGPPPNVDLWTAAYDGDIGEAERQLAWGADVDQIDMRDFNDSVTIAMTPLWCAWNSGDGEEMMDFLYRRGAREYGIRWSRPGYWMGLLPFDRRSFEVEREDLLTVWSRQEALQLIPWFADYRIAVISVAVCAPYDGASHGWGGIRFRAMTGEPYQWVAPKKPASQSWHDFAADTHARAADFIRGFAWPEDDEARTEGETYFCFVPASELEYGLPLDEDDPLAILIREGGEAK